MRGTGDAVEFLEHTALALHGLGHGLCVSEQIEGITG
jgi:hypothetical protein